jgi:regulator of sirC expression with transglutaminase-like and TPR domain
VDYLPFHPVDPRDLPAPAGELFRREVRAANLLALCEDVDRERRDEIAREILALGPDALPALKHAAASANENTAAMAGPLIRMLTPDEIGLQIHRGLLRERRDYAVEQGAVLLARLPYPNLPVQEVMDEIETLAQKAREHVYGRMGIGLEDGVKAADERPLEVVKRLNEFWRDEGFRGNTESYYNDRNSYIPDVLERRTGLPITLSVLYLALARRLYLKAEGVGLPGHFIVRIRVATTKGDQFVLVDPFNGAKQMNVDDCRQRVEAVGLSFTPKEHLRAASTREILARICQNLLALFDHQKKLLDAECVATVLVHLEPRNPVPLLVRAERRLRRGERQGARADFMTVQHLDPDGPIGRTAEELLRRMEFESPFR